MELRMNREDIEAACIAWLCDHGIFADRNTIEFFKDGNNQPYLKIELNDDNEDEAEDGGDQSE